MVTFLYTEGIQLTVAHSVGRCSDLTQEEVQHLRALQPLFPEIVHVFQTRLILVHAGYLPVTDTLSTPTITELPLVE